MHVSLRELIQPHVETLFEDLPADVQSYVAKDFTADAWNCSSSAGRSMWAQRRDAMREADEAVSAEIISTHAYWFKLQGEILTAEREIADLRLMTEKGASQEHPIHTKLAALQVKLAALQKRWHQPDDSAASEQLAAERAAIARTPAILNISKALEFLSESTGATWTEAQLLSVVSNSDIWLYANVPPWTPMYVTQREEWRLRKRPFIKPGRMVLAMLSPDQMKEVWVSGQSWSSTQVADDPFSVGVGYVDLESPISVRRCDIRLTQVELLQILKKWEESRQPIAPVGASDEIVSISSHPGAGHHEQQLREQGDFAPEHQTNSPTSAPQWVLKKPLRFQGYGKPLYDAVKAAYSAGLPVPTARDVLEAFQAKRPPEVVEVMNDGLKYYDGEGNIKFADRSAIKKAIQRLADKAAD